MHWLTLLSLFCFMGNPTEEATARGNPASLLPSEADRSRARDLVQQLGSPIFRERANALRELRKMGRLALEVISPAIESDPDPEVRFRCELLRPAAEAEEFAARMQVLIADTAGQYDHDLPGWHAFQKLAGSDRQARMFFVTLLKSDDNRDLLAGFTGKPEDLRAKLFARLSDLQAKMYPRSLAPGDKRYTPTLEDAVTVILAEATLAETPPPGARLSSTNLIYQNSFRQAIAAPESRKILEPILERWLETRDGSNGLVLAMNVANSLKLPNATRYVLRVLGNDDIPASTRAGAAMMLASSGNKEYIGSLEVLFQNDTVVRRNPREPDIQLRDSALAATVLLSGKDPAEFGFISKNVRAANQKFYYWNYSFPDEKTRENAFSRWKSMKMPGQ